MSTRWVVVHGTRRTVHNPRKIGWFGISTLMLRHEVVIRLHHIYLARGRPRIRERGRGDRESSGPGEGKDVT